MFDVHLIKTLEKADIRYKLTASLRDYTTFRLGGSCPCLIHCESPYQLRTTILELSKNDIEFTLIGAGSNLLVSDNGLSSVVIRYVSSSPSIRESDDLLVVSASTQLDDLVLYSINSGINDFVNCSGIPGTVGGAIAGNAGAFGWQIADCLESVQVVNEKGHQYELLPVDIGFSYRNSGLRTRRDSILKACFRRPPAEDVKKLRAKRQKILDLRASKHPDITIDACAGSFFKNIEPTSAAKRRQAAGWFLEEVGAKSLCVGGAGVFKKHANIIIQKKIGCTAQDVFKLSCKMAEAVQKRFGIQLTREVQLLGDF